MLQGDMLSLGRLQIATVLAALFVSAVSGSPVETKPNFVIIFADDVSSCIVKQLDA